MTILIKDLLKEIGWRNQEESKKIPLDDVVFESQKKEIKPIPEGIQFEQVLHPLQVRYIQQSQKQFELHIHSHFIPFMR